MTDSRLLQLSPGDNVCAARSTIEAGETIQIEGRPVAITVTIPTGHKIAIRPIDPGEKVLKYGAPIGSATRAIHPGDYVHTHNLKSDYLPTYARGASYEPSSVGQ
ncbi:MAG: UxaA family hydrolase [Thermoguttaceae bacterium]